MEKLKGFKVFYKESGRKNDNNSKFAITGYGKLLMYSDHSKTWMEVPKSVYYIQYGDGDLEEN